MKRSLLALALLLPVPTAHAAQADEVKKQDAIYESRGAAVPEGYVIGRTLLSYSFVLPDGFKKSLADLGPQERWLDIGAGEGRAVLDYVTGKYEALYSPGKRGEKKARVTALSIEDRRKPEWYEAAASLEPRQIEYFFGRRLREYSPEELGTFRLMTDVVGAFSYTRFVSTFMENALGRLEVNGSLYTVLQDVRTEDGKNKPYYPNASFLTQIRRKDGSEVKVCEWLKTITCIEVTCEAKPGITPPIEVYAIRKVCDKVSVPPLKLVHFEAGTPPERGFELAN